MITRLIATTHNFLTLEELRCWGKLKLNEPGRQKPDRQNYLQWRATLRSCRGQCVRGKRFLCAKATEKQALYKTARKLEQARLIKPVCQCTNMGKMCCFLVISFQTFLNTLLSFYMPVLKHVWSSYTLFYAKPTANVVLLLWRTTT